MNVIVWSWLLADVRVAAPGALLAMGEVKTSVKTVTGLSSHLVAVNFSMKALE
jgi:hypothetical protein